MLDDGRWVGGTQQLFLRICDQSDYDCNQWSNVSVPALERCMYACIEPWDCFPQAIQLHILVPVSRKKPHQNGKQGSKVSNPQDSPPGFLSTM